MKKYQINIPSACNEDWDAMPLSGKGRQCSKCQENVRDFSYMSDNELIQLLTSDKPHCGNFSSDQLDRVLKVDRQYLLPTFNLRSVAMGFGVLISTTAFATNYSSPSLSLIKMTQGKEVLSSFDNTPPDSVCHFILMDDHSSEFLSGVKLELLDERENIVATLHTNKEGIAIYDRKMLYEQRVTEIRIIPSDDKYKRKIIEFGGLDSNAEVIRLKSKAQKPPKPPKYKGRKLRGVVAYGSKF